VIAEEWYPSKYGQDDLIGAANNLDEGNVQSAAKLIDAGRVYSLAVVLNSQWPSIRERAIYLDVTAMTSPVGPNKLTAHDDKLTTHMALGTSVDGLAHVGIDNRYYNGLKQEDIFAPDG
jgi:hypothetical protein